jgi:hypothetical protein
MNIRTPGNESRIQPPMRLNNERTQCSDGNRRLLPEVAERSRLNATAFEFSLNWPQRPDSANDRHNVEQEDRPTPLF